MVGADAGDVEVQWDEFHPGAVQGLKPVAVGRVVEAACAVYSRRKRADADADREAVATADAEGEADREADVDVDGVAAPWAVVMGRGAAEHDAAVCVRRLMAELVLLCVSAG